MPYVFKRRFHDNNTLFVSKVSFMIGDSAVLSDQDGDITIKEKEFQGSKGL